MSRKYETHHEIDILLLQCSNSRILMRLGRNLLRNLLPCLLKFALRVREPVRVLFRRSNTI